MQSKISKRTAAERRPPATPQVPLPTAVHSPTLHSMRHSSTELPYAKQLLEILEDVATDKSYLCPGA